MFVIASLAGGIVLLRAAPGAGRHNPDQEG
jgi:hypothetical protein